MLQTPNEQNFSRRDFLRGASAAGVAAIAAPVVLTAHGAEGALERIGIGIIGAGDRAANLMAQIHGLSTAHNAEIVALCDVWQPNLTAAATRVKQWWDRAPKTCTRFGDLLAMKDVDAVVIATPDFGHCPILAAALAAGKDAYVEKPMSMDVETANQALDLAREHGRVVQVGTQLRSEGVYRAAAKLLATGVLGKISRVTMSVNFNAPRWARDFDDCKSSDVDWEADLFNRPKQPFDPRLLRRWQLFKLCSSGLPGLWMPHYIDAAHLLLGAKYPASAVAHGATLVWKKDRQQADTFHTVLEYPEGFLASWSMSLGNAAGNCFSIHGTSGTMEMEQLGLPIPLRGRTRLLPAGGSGARVEAQDILPEASLDHMGNWLECLRTRQRPVADIEFGHQHAVAVIMAAAACETGQRQKYDPEKRRIVAG